MLSYKAKTVGIDVIITEESYTSASSFIDNDLIPVYLEGEKNQVTFSGKRIMHRFVSYRQQRVNQ
ncbi:hypothetical protein [Okeania sp. SIO3B5]|uniref:hypothetical protein n=1 Tax=Okeania sp. SIO3B5 TaxID=2607811 RepID=UPI0025EED734|nr:hypothetical protein [Okeania sp. SIO3B5]